MIMSVMSDLADNVIPPRADNGMVFTVSTTARSYDLSGLAMGRPQAPSANTAIDDRLFVNVQAVTADVYVQLNSVSTITLDSTYAQTEGTTGTIAVVSNKVGDLVVAGNSITFMISRSKDKFIHLQGSAAGTARVRFSSEPFPGR
jgi:hypothetical protein